MTPEPYWGSANTIAAREIGARIAPFLRIMISKALSFCPLSTQRGPSNFHDPFSSEWLGTLQPLQENPVLLASDLLQIPTSALFTPSNFPMPSLKSLYPSSSFKMYWGTHNTTYSSTGDPCMDKGRGTYRAQVGSPGLYGFLAFLGRAAEVGKQRF